MEYWKTNENYPKYLLSSNFNVKHIRTDNILNGNSGTFGYKTITMRDKNNKKKSFSYTSYMRTFFSYEWIKELQEGEEVKPLKEYSGYFITNRGRVWSMKHYKFLTLHNHNSYYHLVKIGNEGTHNIHTLVGRYFLPEYREGLFILHKEETLSYPEIHFIENLWIGTKKDNVQDMLMKGRNRNGSIPLTY